VEFEPAHTLFLITNDRPSAPGTDFAFWQRLILVPFKWSFVSREPATEFEKRADTDLCENLLRNEAAGILAWMVKGCLDYQRQGGLDPPQVITEATEQYQRDEDILGNFLEVHCEVGKLLETMFKPLHERFLTWYHDNINSKKDPSPKYFGDLLGKRFEKSKDHGLIKYHGLKLRDDWGG